jgi:DNA-binding IclR family transcriptional regulator
MTHDPLLTRIRGEYVEMPGLRLTLGQACRLWQLDPATCGGLLTTLVDERFLYRTRDGSYVVLPTPHATAAKAALPIAFSPPARRQRPA